MDNTKSLNKKIEILTKQNTQLENKVKDLSTNTEEKELTPFSKVGGVGRRTLSIGDIVTGGDGIIIWNDEELKFPAFGTKISEPTRGYNNHFHTQYSGGALDIHSLEIVEYDTNWETDTTHSKHSQKFWKTIPLIKKVQNTKNENIEKIGNLALVFDADSITWGTSAFEIDIEKCYFVQKELNGDIKLDSNGKPMRSLIFNTDANKNSLVWDKVNLCWKFYAVYAEVPTP